MMNKNKAGFTLLEIMIVITIMSVIAATTILANLVGQLAKGRNARRVVELSQMMKAFEDYYNDKGQYPAVVAGTIDGLNCKASPTSLKPYLQLIACDPQYPNHTYIYVTDDASRQKIRLYAQMESPLDVSISQNPCAGGCTVNCTSCKSQIFNYLITSPNVDISGSGKLPPAGAIIP